jgi:hypothetical protein
LGNAYRCGKGIGEIVLARRHEKGFLGVSRQRAELAVGDGNDRHASLVRRLDDVDDLPRIEPEAHGNHGAIG